MGACMGACTGCIYIVITYKHIAVLQLVIRAQKEIAEEHLQELCGGVNTLLQIRIVSADKCISEIKKRLLRLGNRRQINV